MAEQELVLISMEDASAISNYIDRVNPDSEEAVLDAVEDMRGSITEMIFHTTANAVAHANEVLNNPGICRYCVAASDNPFKIVSF